MDYQKVDLSTINAGAVLELFEVEWKKLLQNIQDPNTKPDASRELKIRIIVKPDKNRSSAQTKISVTSKLENIQPHESFIVLSTDGNDVTAYTTNPKQQEIDFPNIREFKEVK